MTGTKTLDRRTVLKYAGGAGAAAVLASCAPAGPAAKPALTPRRGGTVTYAASAEIISPDPAYSGDSTSGAVELLIFEPLIGQNADLELLPRLATSWEGKDLVWTVKLRTGVKFHDGTPFDAAAAKAHFDRLAGPEKPTRGGGWVAIVDKVEAPDPQTVRFTTKAIDAFFPYRLALPSLGFIESPTAVAKLGKDQFAKSPVGTGPFKFAEWVKDDHFTVVRNDEYWGDKAYLDKVIIKPVPEAEARAIGLESGDFQMIIRLNPEQLPRFQSDRFALSVMPTIRTFFIGMAAMKKPFSDIRVRQALNHAVDKQTIAKNLYAGLGEVLGGQVPPGVPGYAPMAGFAYDPAKAKQLLAEAGYPSGFSATLTGTKGSYLKDAETAQAIQQQLRAVGVDVKLEIVEFAKYLDLIRTDPAKSPLEMWFDSWIGVDGSGYIVDRYGCAKFRPGGANTAGFCDPAVDTVALSGLATTDVVKRDALLKQAQELISKDAPSIWLLAAKEAAGLSTKIHAVVHRRDAILTVDEHTWIEA